MSGYGLDRRLAAEAIGTAFLVGTVVGSGIMADNLTGDAALTLLGNALPTGAILVVLITVLGPISGAHLNPLVTLAFLGRRTVTGKTAAMYVCAQLLGAFVGLFAAHAMFDLPLVQLGTRPRTGWGQWLAEFVATFGLIALILTAARRREGTLGTLVGLYIGAAYWFTASTSFANPAVAIARAFTDTFSNIRLGDVPAFVLAEAMGCLVAFLAVRWLTAPSASKRRDGEPAPPVLAAEG